MSKVSLAGNASGTGIFTIASPNSNTDRTLTLPDNTGTLLTTSSVISRSNLPTGSVLQVVQNSTTSFVSSSTTTYIDSNLQASITPYFSTSKILVLITHQGARAQNNTYMFMRLVRDGTTLEQFTQDILWAGGGTQSREIGIAHNYLDSPATTSSVTYKTTFMSGGNIADVSLQNNSRPSRMTLLEIAG
jgi:hypothetical protein